MIESLEQIRCNLKVRAHHFGLLALQGTRFNAVMVTYDSSSLKFRIICILH